MILRCIIVDDQNDDDDQNYNNDDQNGDNHDQNDDDGTAMMKVVIVTTELPILEEYPRHSSRIPEITKLSSIPGGLPLVRFPHLHFVNQGT